MLNILRRPKNDTFIPLRKSYIDICKGNHCAAALLAMFEYWHTLKIQQSYKATISNDIAERHGDLRYQDESLFQFYNESELEYGLQNLYGRKAIAKAINEILIPAGFISIHRNPNPKYRFDNTRYILFSVDIVQKELDKLSYDQAFLRDRSSQNDLPDQVKTLHAQNQKALPQSQKASRQSENALRESPQVVDCVHARAREDLKITSEITTKNTKEEREELSSANAMSAKETLQPSQAQVAGNMNVTPAQEREVSSATPTTQSDSSVPGKKAAAPANKEEKPKRELHEFYEIFKDTYNDEYNPATYVSKQGDFVQLANLRKAQGQALTYRDWCIAVKHYFRTPLANHTLADLAVRYATFRRHALDKFGKPAEPPKPKQIDWNWGN